eukprot:SAG22_NODE_5342_length_1033_cov_1.055675_1_plen_219_part_00
MGAAGFGGGDIISENLVLNMVRESKDHGECMALCVAEKEREREREREVLQPYSSIVVPITFCLPSRLSAYPTVIKIVDTDSARHAPSGSAGPWNSWDRVPYITTVRNGTASIVPATREIHHNFVIANYNSEGAIDTDDGSAYYHVHHNFFAYGANGLKSDFGGHDNRHTSNVYAFPGGCFGAPMPFRYFHGFNDAFYNNSCVAHGAPNGYGVGLSSSD